MLESVLPMFSSRSFIVSGLMFELVLMRWMKLEPIIHSEVNQKEKHQYSILTPIYGIQKDGNDNPVCKTAKKTQMYRTVFCSSIFIEDFKIIFQSKLTDIQLCIFPHCFYTKKSFPSCRSRKFHLVLSSSFKHYTTFFIYLQFMLLWGEKKVPSFTFNFSHVANLIEGMRSR